MKTVTVPVDTIKGLLRAAAAEDPRRSYLESIHFNFDRGCAAATDGAIAVFARLKEQMSGAGIVTIPRGPLADAVKLCGRKFPSINIDIEDDGKVTLYCAGATVATQTIESQGDRYPQIENSVPSELSGEPAQFDPELVARAAAALDDIVVRRFEKSSLPVSLAYNGNRAAVMYPNGGDSGVFAIIMPWRADVSAEDALSAITSTIGDRTTATAEPEAQAEAA